MTGAKHTASSEYLTHTKPKRSAWWRRRRNQNLKGTKKEGA